MTQQDYYISAVDQVVDLTRALEAAHETSYSSLAFAWGRVHELEERLEDLEEEHGSTTENINR
jgi:hypothetical protein